MAPKIVYGAHAVHFLKMETFFPLKGTCSRLPSAHIHIVRYLCICIEAFLIPFRAI